jgi:hypothetical protein
MHRRSRQHRRERVFPISWAIPLLRVLGIEIKVHVTFVLILAWAAYYWGIATGAGLQATSLVMPADIGEACRLLTARPQAGTGAGWPQVIEQGPF